MCYVYAIRSQSHGRFYVGLTADPINRLKEHNSGRSKSTKRYKPWTLVLTEQFQSRSAARAREKYLKSGSGNEFIKKYWAGISV